MFSRKKEIQKRRIKTISIICGSLIVALGINFLWLNKDVNIQKYKADVLNSSIKQELGEVYLENINGRLHLKTNKEMEKVKTVSFSIFYNPEILEINGIESDFETDNIYNQNEVKGTNAITITYKNETNIIKGDSLAEIEYIKTEEGKNSNELNVVNLRNVLFIDGNNESYTPSTSGAEFK